jgi:hypothetical protein
MEFQTLAVVKPTIIRYATACLWTSTIIELFQTVVLFPQAIVKYEFSPGFDITAIVMMFSLHAWLIWQISEGKNWARIAFLILQASMWLNSAFASHVLVAVFGFQRVLAVVSNILLFAGLALVFIGPGRHWFTSVRRLKIEWK